jgi:hypothetical protein
MVEDRWHSLACVAADHEGWEAERAEVRARLDDLAQRLGGDQLWMEFAEPIDDTVVYRYVTRSRDVLDAYQMDTLRNSNGKHP